MIRVVILPCKLPRAEADALNRESGRLYTLTLVEHYRVYRKKGIWLSQYAAVRLNDGYHGGTFLHAHSVDAAQEGFYKACKTARELRRAGENDARFPYRRKMYRTTTWKQSGIKVVDDRLRLALARGYDYLWIDLPPFLQDRDDVRITQVELVYDQAGRRYHWHVTLDDGQPLPDVQGTRFAGVDLGEIHPAALTDGEEAVVIACRELRAVNQYTHKLLAKLRRKQAHYQRGSRRWRRIQQRITRFLAQQNHRQTDIEHRLSRHIVDWALRRDVRVLAIGDVRDIADGKRLNRVSQQKISAWSHGKLRKYIRYKAEAVGIKVVDDVPEHYTSQTCPLCGERHSPKGRRFICPQDGQMLHRDVVGAANILSRYLHNELGQIPAPAPKYRYPVLRGKRSPSVTGQVAR